MITMVYCIIKNCLPCLGPLFLFFLANRLNASSHSHRLGVVKASHQRRNLSLRSSSA
jgi:hypothetical protein